MVGRQVNCSACFTGLPGYNPSRYHIEAPAPDSAGVQKPPGSLTGWAQSQGLPLWRPSHFSAWAGLFLRAAPTRLGTEAAAPGLPRPRRLKHTTRAMRHRID